MDKDIQRLADEDTAILFERGWKLDKLIGCEASHELETYEQALALAHKCADQMVGLRSSSAGGKQFWEVWRLPVAK